MDYQRYVQEQCLHTSFCKYWSSFMASTGIYLDTPMGYWFLLEMIGFVLIPMMLFFYSYRTAQYYS